jgi:hypothetical protein
MQLMQYLATNMMPLIVTNITQNCTAQMIKQKFVLHMNTAVSEDTDILKVLSNAMSKFRVMNFLYITLLTPGFFI